MFLPGMLKITAVAPQSLGAELGLQVGTEVLAVNGREVEDFLDWEFLTADEQLLLLVRHPGGAELEYDIERPEGMAMGVSVEPPRIRRCANRCDFCFVDGLPPGLRATLYVRDDDYRLSFKYGNFATLTNLKPRDLARIIEYRLSPLYVSVHATDPVIRRWLLRNPLAPDILEQLKHFDSHGIQCHTQVVLSPGVNDREVLERTLSDLWAIGPSILSVSVVPVGLTTFSKHHLVREPGRDECRTALRQVEHWAERARLERGRSWVMGADELYLRAEWPLPPAEAYDDFEQVENGVGAVRYLQVRIREGEGRFEQWRGRRIAVLTGISMAALMPQVLEPLTRTTGATFLLLPLENPLFGGSVTCAGLLPGAAFRSALAGLRDVDLALIPAESLNDDQLFMDDLSLAVLRTLSPVEVRPSYHFTDALKPSASP
jgi:putative radical SAM enzyme (TIGR03279 family)